jgi:multiple sugar transport system substrate-binding protein
VRTGAKPSLALVAAFVLLAGCSSRKGREISIVFAAGNDPSGATAALIDEYNKAHPGVVVEFQAMPANTDQQHDAYVTYLSARESDIDLYSLDVIWTAEFARAGWIAELPAGFVSQAGFLEGPLESVTYQGKLYAVPWFTDAGVLYYRKDLLEKAGLAVPATWEELADACGKVDRPADMDGFVWQGARYEGLVCDFLEFLWGHGGTIDADAIASAPADVEARITETLKFMLGLIDQGISPEAVLTYKEEDSRRVFTEGHALFLRNWPYAWSMAQGAESKVKDLVGIAPVPHAEGQTSYATIGGWNVALSAMSKHPKEALEFLAFITGEQALKERAIKGAYLPTRRNVYRDPDVLRANPHFASFFDIVGFMRNRPSSAVYPRASDIIQENVHGVLSRERTPEDAAKAIVNGLALVLSRQ